ncbi:hypothetical protein [Couchioplanes caeruleus]|uniref:Uncharacterized protein n=2 Tax=Couchioplanes caeruleus TaxID=56438 RepID=A0A1K0GEV8_9ACTN|nr:hypothetical protein [Couchioplanes caeruleus]OJF09356.1 hypothetical protein BG844_38105 [Couchioplanes caeruleus subsp. caeruleus]ROP32054.1 hypothetical protein EDD30_4984 [Couchioplanes caeruleus]
MKVDLKDRRIVIGVAVAVVVLVGLAIGRSAQDAGPGRLDDGAERACTAFAAGYADAGTKTARLSLADEVGKRAADSGNARIAERATALGRSANETATAWKADATAFTQACRDAGWSSTG